MDGYRAYLSFWLQPQDSIDDPGCIRHDVAWFHPVLLIETPI